MSQHPATPGGAALERLRPDWTRDPQRTAIYTLIALMATWLVIILAVQAVMIVQHGYGSGLNHHHRIPPELVKRVGVGNDLEKIMKATNKP